MAVVTYRESLRRFLENPQRRTYSFLGFTLVLVLIFLIGAIRPTVATISSLYSEIKEREQVDAALQAKLNSIQSLQTDYLESQDELSFLDVFFPENGDYSLFLASVEKVGNTYGFKSKNIAIESGSDTFSNTSLYSDMETVSVSISATGPFSNITEYVAHLENLPTIPDITSVSFIPGREDPTSVEIIITMRMYKQASSDLTNTVDTTNSQEEI
ncbi:type 4a pilus biogenesis protein PilO [Candidatus Dojkabacteria bacterium]|nr:type 4a pilus biogenesis protein PilO [Candidatus Dojkabacteria bacterium]